MADLFALALADFAAKAPEQARNVVRKVAGDALTKVVRRTPVGNPTLWKSKPPKGYVGGRLRGNWNTSLGAVDVTTTATVDKSGQATIARGLAVIAVADVDRSIYITNSLPYVREIEYEGHSRLQTPAGMVRVTVSELQVMVDDAVRSLR